MWEASDDDFVSTPPKMSRFEDSDSDDPPFPDQLEDEEQDEEIIVDYDQDHNIGRFLYGDAINWDAVISGQSNTIPIWSPPIKMTTHEHRDSSASRSPTATCQSSSRY